MRNRVASQSVVNGLAPDKPADDIEKQYGPCSAARRIKIARQLEGEAAALYASAFEMRPQLKRPAPPKKIPKAFFLLRMVRSEQDELRRLANSCGIDLRSALDWAVRNMRWNLKEKARIRLLTGMSLPEQAHLLGIKNGDN